MGDVADMMISLVLARRSERAYFLKSMVGQAAYQPRKVQFRFSSLEAEFECGLEPALCLGGARNFAEQIEVAAKVLGRCERDRIDALLDRGQAGGPETL